MNSSEKFTSAYYPRRARWYGRIFYWGTAVRHRLALDRLHLPGELTLGGLSGSFFIPGLAVYLRGPRLWGKATLAACALLFLLFIVFLGHPSGNYAFGLMLSIHTTGFVYYCSPVLINRPFHHRIFLTIGVMLALGLMLYSPLRHCWLTPLQTNGHTIIVQKLVSARTVKRGDPVAYTAFRVFFFQTTAARVL